MRHSLILASGFLLALATPTLASNVLLPSANSPSLGISPSAPAAAPALTPTEQTPAALAPAPAAPAPAPAPTTTAAAPEFTNAPQSQTGTADTTQYITPIDQAGAAGLPQGAIPTQVIQEPEVSDAMLQSSRNLPFGLVITITNQSVFGGQDVQTITNKLGLKRTDIPSSCVLAPRGVLQTTKGDYLITGKAGPSTLVKYDGAIKNFVLNTTALCVVNGRLPPGSGFLEKNGNYFSISLEMFKCPLPTRQASQLNITYTGTETAQCVYQ